MRHSFKYAMRHPGYPWRLLKHLVRKFALSPTEGDERG